MSKQEIQNRWKDFSAEMDWRAASFMQSIYDMRLSLQYSLAFLSATLLSTLFAKSVKKR